MPTVIDSLVLELGLDPAKFTAGQKEALEKFKQLQEAARKGGKDTEDQSRRVMDGFASIKREALGLIGLFFGGRGVKEMIGYLTTFDAAAGRSAKTLNISTKELSTWQGVAEQTGGTAEGVTGSMQGLTDQIEKFKAGMGDTGFLAILNSLDVSLQDNNGKWKTAGQLFRDLNHAVQSLDPAQARVRLAALAIDPATINTLLIAEEAFRKLYEEQERLGQITKEDADAATALQKSWHEAEKAAASLSRKVSTSLTPSLIGFLDRWRDVFAELGRGYVISPNSLFGRALGLKYSDDDEKLLKPRPTPIDRLMGATTPSSDSDRATPATKGPIDRTRDFYKWLYTGETPSASTPSAQTTDATKAGMGETRGDRDNNPGNIEYGSFAVRHGATGSDGRFAIFPTKEAGEKAMSDLLAANYGGLTLAEIQRKWVGNVDQNYLGSMMRSTGLAASSVPNIQDAAMRQRIIAGMARGEGTHLTGGVWTGIPLPPGLGRTIVAPAALAATNNSSTKGGTNTNTVNITNLNVNAPHAADAAGIVREIGPALQRSGMAAQANFGQV